MSKFLKKTVAILLSFSMVAACVGINTSTAKAAETMPVGLTKTTWSDFGLTDGTKNGCGTGTSVLGTLFSGYITFTQAADYFIFGSSDASNWSGVRFKFASNATDLYLDYCPDGSTPSQSWWIRAAETNVGTTFQGQRFLLQITTEVENTTDVKLGIWINGVLHNDTYITLTGAASTIGTNVYLNQATAIESYTYVDPEPEVELEKIPRGLTKLTYSDWGWGNQNGATGLQSDATKTVEGALFSGYLTLHGTGQFIHYGATTKTGYDGLRIKNNGDKLVLFANGGASANLSIGGDTPATFKYLTLEGAGLSGDSFCEQKILLQISVQTEGSDLKVGLWFNGKLYSNSYFTVSGGAGTFGGYMNFVNEGTVDIESHAYVDPELIPTGLTKLTYSDWGWEKQNGATGLQSDATKTVEGALFSGYLTLHGTGQFIHYGTTTKTGYDGLRIKNNGDKLVLFANGGASANLSIGGDTPATFKYLTLEGAGLSGDSFCEQKILLQISVQTEGSDLKVGLWFNGKLYSNSYFTVSGGAGTFGGYMNFVNEGTVDIESYTYVDLEPEIEVLPTGLKNTTFIDYGWKDGLTAAEGGSTVHKDTTVDGHLFSGKITFTGASNIFTYGGKAGWTGIKLLYQGANTQLTYVNPAGNSETVLKVISAEAAGVGETFADTEFLLQITTEVVGDDVKLGVWFEGVLYENEYITLEGKASELGNVMFFQKSATIASYPALEKLPTNFKEVTFIDYGWKDQTTDAQGGSATHADATVDKHLFSGTVKFTGSNTTVTYGSKAAWQGIKLLYQGNKIDLKYVDAAWGETLLKTITAEEARIGTTFADTKILLQLTTEIVGSDVKLGVWFNGLLYGNEYVILEGKASELGNVMFFSNAATIQSYPEIIPEELPTGWTTLTPYEFGIASAVHQSIASQPAPYGSTTKVSKFDEVILYFGDTTFGQNVTLSFGGSDEWGGLQLIAIGDELQIQSGYGHILGIHKLSDVTAGVDLVGGTYDLKITMKHMSESELQIGLWFNDVLYGNEYFTADLTKLATTGNGDKLGTFVSIIGRTNPGTITFNYENPVDLSGLKKVTFADFGLMYAGHNFTVDGFHHTTLDSLMNTSLREKVTFQYDGTGRYWFQYGGTTQGSYYGIRFMAVNGTDFEIVAAGDEGQEPFTLGSVRTLKSSGDMQFFNKEFELGIDLLQDGNDVLMFVYYDGELCNGIPFRLQNFAKSATPLSNTILFCPDAEYGNDLMIFGANQRDLPEIWYNLDKEPYSKMDGTQITTAGVHQVEYTENGVTYHRTVNVFELGNATASNGVNSADLVAAKKHLAHTGYMLPEVGAYGVDFNQDNVIDAEDIYKVRRVLLGDKFKVEMPVQEKILGTQDVMPILGYYGPTSGVEHEMEDGQIIASPNTITDDVYKLISEAGINLVANLPGTVIRGAGNWLDTKTQLDLAAKYGVKLFIHDARVDVQNPTDDLQHKMFDLYREHPGFAGVYGHDEPHSSDYSTRSDWENARVQMGDYQEASRLLSTTYDITCYENLLPYWENAATHSGDNAAEGYQAYLQDYITRYDPHHLSFDYYLFGVTEGFWIFSSDRDVDKSAEFMQNMVMIRNAAKGADIPFWSFVQAGANWNDAAEWMESTTNDTPTKGQFHWNVNIALTYGAQGIEYFPMIQPHYYAATSGGGMDYDRNGLLGADGTPTQWYTYAQEANKQIAAVDHVLMAAEHKGVIPVSGYAASQNKASTLNALGDENLVISKYGKLTGVTAEDTTYGAIVGCFDYNGKDAFYVTSYDVKNAQNVTLSFSESVSAEVIMKGATSQKTGTSMTLTLDAGEAALVVLN